MICTSFKKLNCVFLTFLPGSPKGMSSSSIATTMAFIDVRMLSWTTDFRIGKQMEYRRGGQRGVGRGGKG